MMSAPVWSHLPLDRVLSRALPQAPEEGLGYSLWIGETYNYWRDPGTLVVLQHRISRNTWMRGELATWQRRKVCPPLVPNTMH